MEHKFSSQHNNFVVFYKVGGFPTGENCFRIMASQRTRSILVKSRIYEFFLEKKIFFSVFPRNLPRMGTTTRQPMTAAANHQANAVKKEKK